MIISSSNLEILGLGWLMRKSYLYKNMLEKDPQHAKKNFQDLMKAFETSKLPE